MKKIIFAILVLISFSATAYEMRGFKIGMTLSEAKKVDLSSMFSYSPNPSDERTFDCDPTRAAGYSFPLEVALTCKPVAGGTYNLGFEIGSHAFYPYFIFYKNGDKEPILAAIDSEISTDSFGTIAQALQKKYGAAPKTSGALQNGFGARFSQQEIFISNSTASIWVEKYSTGSSRAGWLRYADTKAWNALMAAKKKTQKNDL